MKEIDVALRLTEERKRLEFSQAGFARLLGINRATLIKNESGLSDIKSGVLFNAAKFGIDVQYILTGIRSTNLTKIQDEVGFENIAIKGKISGVGVAQTGATVNIINTKNHTTKIKAETSPNKEHISIKQRATLQSLVKKVVETESKLKKNPRSFRAVWSSLNSHCKVSSYSLIPLNDFEKAQKYLHQWLGRLNSMKSAPIKDGDNWRKRHYAYIKINTKRSEDASALDNYMLRKFKAKSLTELSNDELKTVYQYVAGRRNKRK